MIIVVMGVTGSGKTTVGGLLAARLGWKFADADNFHSAANIEKIARGEALTNADREPWLATLHAAIEGWKARNENVVLACSALKKSYRETLGIGGDVHLVYLKGSYEQVAYRLRARHGHFATEAILADQFKTLEEPTDAVTMEVGPPAEEIARAIQAALGLA
jgi:gluconokinase